MGLFERGVGAKRLRVVNWGKWLSSCPGVWGSVLDSPAWQQGQAFKGATHRGCTCFLTSLLLESLLMLPIPAFTPKLCGQVTGNLHVALSNGLLGLYVVLSDTLDHLFLPEARFPRHRGHPTVLVLLLLHWPICHSLLLASLLLLFPRCSVKAWSGPSSSPWAFSLSSFIYQHVHLDSSLASQTSQIKQAYGTLDAPPSVHIWLSPTPQYEALAIIHLIPNAPRVTGEHSWPLAFLFFSTQPNSESWWLSFKQIGYEPVSLWSPPQPSRSKLLSCLLWLIKWPPNWSQYFLSCLFQPVFHRVFFERHIMLLCYLKSFSDGPLPWR